MNWSRLWLLTWRSEGAEDALLWAGVGLLVAYLLSLRYRALVVWLAVAAVAVLFFVVRVPKDDPRSADYDAMGQPRSVPRTVEVYEDHNFVRFYRLTPGEWRVRQVVLVVIPTCVGAVLGCVLGSRARRRYARLPPDWS